MSVARGAFADALGRGAVAAARSLSPRAMVMQPELRGSPDDDAAEPVERAWVAEGEGRALWVGLTATQLAMPPGEGAAGALFSALTAALVEIGWWREGTARPRPASLEERASAVAPGEGKAVWTVVIDVKLAQLLATTLVVIDAVQREGFERRG